MKVYRLLKYLAMILICLVCLMPFYIMVILALNVPGQSFYQGNMFLPDFQFRNFVEAWTASHIDRAIFNSAVITVFSLFLIVALGSMAGYAIARFRYKFNTAIFWIFLCCMMIPGIIITVPLYTLMLKLNAIDTLWGMACICAANAIPASVFIFTGFVRTSPKEIEEAAIMDGCSFFGAFWRVTFPLLKPSVAAVMILNGFGIWNNYAQAVFFLQDSKKYNVAKALSIFFQQFSGTDWYLIAATAIIAIVPVLLVFLIFQKSLMRGLTEGALKG